MRLEKSGQSPRCSPKTKVPLGLDQQLVEIDLLDSTTLSLRYSLYGLFSTRIVAYLKYIATSNAEPVVRVAGCLDQLLSIVDKIRSKCIR